MAITPLQRRIRDFGKGAPMHHTTRTGKLVGIREHYDDKNMAQMDLEDEAPPPKPKGKKGDAVPSDTYRRRFEAVVPKQHTAGLKLGDRVHVHTRVEKAGPAKLPTPRY